ncbi:MAG: transposase [Candidatus Nitrotoga sp.]
MRSKPGLLRESIESNPINFTKLDRLSAQAVVAVYAQRMQIEALFRDLKSEHFGLGFSASRSTQKNRLGVLLLVACLVSFVLRLSGEVGKARQLEFKFQSNTRRSRPVLSDHPAL